MPVTEEDLQKKERLPVEAYFSETYTEAREKFRWVAKALGTQIPVRVESLRVKEPDYTIDVAVIQGSGSRGLAVHSSGVHGVEGFAGSAVQTAVLHEMLCSGIRPAVTCVLVHVVNPFGMAHFRRWNENNVDLNRNALTPEGWKEVLEREPNIAGYEDFLGLLLADAPPSPWFVWVGLWLRTFYLLARYGIRHLKRAMVTATYHHTKGIFFGGRELQPSHRLLGEFLTKNFGTVSGEEVAWVDVHTGLGPTGVDVLLVDSENKEEVTGNLCGAEVQSCDDAGNANGSQAAGYELVRGFLKQYYSTIFKTSPGKRSPVIVTQEFGTVPPILVARSLIIENRGWHFDSARRAYWSTYTRDAFYVREPPWKASILERGRSIFHQLQQLTAKRANL